MTTSMLYTNIASYHRDVHAYSNQNHHFRWL